MCVRARVCARARICECVQFAANTDPANEVTNWFSPPVLGRYLRITRLTWASNGGSLRAAILAAVEGADTCVPTAAPTLTACPKGTCGIPPGCAQCKLGYFAGEEGLRDCKPCPEGKKTAFKGADAEKYCTRCLIYVPLPTVEVEADAFA